MKGLIEKIDTILKKSRSFKSTAHTDREFEDFDSAIENLDRAISYLEPMLIELEEMDSHQASEDKLKLAKELADCYGSKGGIFRRQKLLEDAEKMYKKGCNYEVKYKIPDTYNQINVIVLKLLRNPDEHVKLEPIISNSLKIIEQRVIDKDKNNWWAWADFGLLNLLYANLTPPNCQNFLNKAHEAYINFKNNGADIEHFESALNVLKQLEKEFESVGNTTYLLMQKEVEYLEQNMP